MKDLQDIRKDNAQAALGERQRLLARLHEVEAILGIPPSAVNAWDLSQLRSRLAKLQAIAASRIDPDDPELQAEPYTLGQHLDQSPRIF